MKQLYLNLSIFHEFKFLDQSEAENSAAFEIGIF